MNASLVGITYVAQKRQTQCRQPAKGVSWTAGHRIELGENALNWLLLLINNNKTSNYSICLPLWAGWLFWKLKQAKRAQKLFWQHATILSEKREVRIYRETFSNLKVLVLIRRLLFLD